MVPADARFSSLAACSAVRRPGAARPVPAAGARATCPQARRCGWDSSGAAPRCPLWRRHRRRPGQHLPAGFHLPAQLAVQAVGLLHGAPAEARRFAAGSGHGLGAVTLEGAVVAQPLELRHKVEHWHAAAACSHQRAAAAFAQGGHQAGLAHQNDPGQPLQRLLDSRRVDAEQDLGAGAVSERKVSTAAESAKQAYSCSVKAGQQSPQCAAAVPAHVPGFS